MQLLEGQPLELKLLHSAQCHKQKANISAKRIKINRCGFPLLLKFIKSFLHAIVIFSLKAPEPFLLQIFIKSLETRFKYSNESKMCENSCSLEIISFSFEIFMRRSVC